MTKKSIIFTTFATVSAVTTGLSILFAGNLSAEAGLKARTIHLLTSEMQLDSWTEREQIKVVALSKTPSGINELKQSIANRASFVYSSRSLNAKTNSLLKASLGLSNVKANVVDKPEFSPSKWSSVSLSGNAAQIVVRGSFRDSINGVKTNTPGGTFHLKLVRKSSNSPWLIERERITNYNPS